MDTEDVFEFLKSLRLPLGTRMDSFSLPGGHLFRLRQEESRGFQMLLTDEVAGLYGENQAVILVLGRSQAMAASPLPPALPDGQFQQVTFPGE